MPKAKIENYTFSDPQGIMKYKDDQRGIFFVVVDGAIRQQHTCRDSFERRCQEFNAQTAGGIMLGKKLQVAFKTNKINLERMEAFWKPIFKKLGKESVFLFHTCNIETSVVINMRKWWMQNQMRRAVFSMLLRASCVYASFDEASKNYYIMQNTLAALTRFLEGYTIPTFQFQAYNYSWHYYFKAEVNPKLDTMMAKPKAGE